MSDPAPQVNENPTAEELEKARLPEVVTEDERETFEAKIEELKEEIETLKARIHELENPVVPVPAPSKKGIIERFSPL